MKKVTLSISPTVIKESFFSFLHRFHLMIFVIVVLGGVAASIFILNAIVIRSNDTSDAPANTTSAKFDEATMKRIDELKTRDQGANNLDLSKGRTNPFVE
jgi:hypothetical protein